MLFRTGWDRHWGTERYGEPDHPSLSVAAAERLGVRLNGLLGAGMDAGFAKHRRSLVATPIQPATPGTTT